PEVRKDRCDRLAALERDLANRFYERYVGRESEVLVEQPVAGEPGWYEGTDRRYMPVRLPADASDAGKFVRAVGVAARREFLLAEPVARSRQREEARCQDV